MSPGCPEARHEDGILREKVISSKIICLSAVGPPNKMETVKGDCTQFRHGNSAAINLKINVHELISIQYSIQYTKSRVPGFDCLGDQMEKGFPRTIALSLTMQRLVRADL